MGNLIVFKVNKNHCEYLLILHNYTDDDNTNNEFSCCVLQAAFEPLSNSLCGFYKGFQQLLSWTEALRGKGVRSSGPSQPHVVPNAPREPLLEIKIKTITIIILWTKLALIIDKAKLFMQDILKTSLD